MNVQVARATNKNKNIGMRHGCTYYNGGIFGVDAVAMDVQLHLALGHNAFTVVGLLDKSVAESRERVRAALSAMGLALQYERITINL